MVEVAWCQAACSMPALWLHGSAPMCAHRPGPARPRQVCLRAPALERRLAALDPAAGALAAPNGGPPPDAPAFLRQPESLEARALIPTLCPASGWGGLGPAHGRSGCQSWPRGSGTLRVLSFQQHRGEDRGTCTGRRHGCGSRARARALAPPTQLPACKADGADGAAEG